MTYTHLNFGCGRYPREGWANLDIASLQGVTHVHDFTKTPYPFPDNQFTHILASHVLEHVPPTIGSRDGLSVVIDELFRILAPGGVLHIKLPHYKRRAYDYLTNPSHYRILSPNSFLDFMLNANPLGSMTYHTSARFHKMTIKHNRRAYAFGRWLQPYHFRKYLRRDYPPFFNRPYECEIFLHK